MSLTSLIAKVILQSCTAAGSIAPIRDILHPTQQYMPYVLKQQEPGMAAGSTYTHSDVYAIPVFDTLNLAQNSVAVEIDDCAMYTSARMRLSARTSSL